MFLALDMTITMLSSSLCVSRDVSFLASMRDISGQFALREQGCFHLYPC